MWFLLSLSQTKPQQHHPQHLRPTKKMTFHLRIVFKSPAYAANGTCARKNCWWQHRFHVLFSFTCRRTFVCACVAKLIWGRMRHSPHNLLRAPGIELVSKLLPGSKRSSFYPVCVYKAASRSSSPEFLVLSLIFHFPCRGSQNSVTGRSHRREDFYIVIIIALHLKVVHFIKQIICKLAGCHCIWLICLGKIIFRTIKPRSCHRQVRRCCSCIRTR